MVMMMKIFVLPTRYADYMRRAMLLIALIIRLPLRSMIITNARRVAYQRCCSFTR